MGTSVQHVEPHPAGSEHPRDDADRLSLLPPCQTTARFVVVDYGVMVRAVIQASVKASRRDGAAGPRGRSSWAVLGEVEGVRDGVTDALRSVVDGPGVAEGPERGGDGAYECAD